MFNEHLQNPNKAWSTAKTNNNHFSKTRKILQIIFGTTREINVFTIKFGRYKLKI